MDCNVLKATGIVRYIDRKNSAGKIRSIYLLHCYRTVYLPELSSKLKTVLAGSWLFKSNALSNSLIHYTVGTPRGIGALN